MNSTHCSHTWLYFDVLFSEGSTYGFYTTGQIISYFNTLLKVQSNCHVSCTNQPRLFRVNQRYITRSKPYLEILKFNFSFRWPGRGWSIFLDDGRSLTLNLHILADTLNRDNIISQLAYILNEEHQHPIQCQTIYKWQTSKSCMNKSTHYIDFKTLSAKTLI